MPRGGKRPNAGRPPGARNKSKATAAERPRMSARRLAKAAKMDSLQLTMTAARELYAKGEVAEAGKMAARAMPYTVQRYRPWHGDAPRSEEQLALDLPMPMPAAIAADADEAKPNKWKSLLN